MYHSMILGKSGRGMVNAVTTRSAIELRYTHGGSWRHVPNKSKTSDKNTILSTLNLAILVYSSPLGRASDVFLRFVRSGCTEQLDGETTDVAEAKREPSRTEEDARYSRLAAKRAPAFKYVASS